jgi:PAS domain S-box-containing protein
MSFEQAIVIYLITLGALFLFYSLLPISTILRRLRNEKSIRIWKILRYFIAFFGVGYIGSIIFFLMDINIFNNLLMGIIYFFGSLFVFLVVKTSQNTIVDLFFTQRYIEESDTKIHQLLENTRDIIFTMDQSCVFLTINKAATQLLGYGIKDLIGKNLFDLLLDQEDNTHFNISIVKAKIDELFKTQKPVIFRSKIRHKYSIEPAELNIQLELLKFSDQTQILGKAAEVVEDVLSDSFMREKQTYKISNLLSSAEYISERACRNLGKFISQSEINLLRLGIRELIINAIEHGNLSISFDEKSKAQQDANYFELILSRQTDPENSRKKVTVEYSVTDKQAVFTILDEGNGFDYKKITSELQDVVTGELEHGRGLLLAGNAFDKIEYNEAGNQVTLIKYFK